MKQYQIGQKVFYKATDFDGTFTCTCKITEVTADHAVAVEINEPHRPMRLWIDADTDYAFTIL